MMESRIANKVFSSCLILLLGLTFTVLAQNNKETIYILFENGKDGMSKISFGSQDKDIRFRFLVESDKPYWNAFSPLETEYAISDNTFKELKIDLKDSHWVRNSDEENPDFWRDHKGDILMVEKQDNDSYKLTKVKYRVIAE